MEVELVFDNGVIYTLKIPKSLFTVGTKQFFIDTFTDWVNTHFAIDEVKK